MSPDCCPPLAPANGTNITNKKDVPPEDKHHSPGLEITQSRVLQPIRAHTIHTRRRPPTTSAGHRRKDGAEGRSEDSSGTPWDRHPKRWARLGRNGGIGGPQRGGWCSLVFPGARLVGGWGCGAIVSARVVLPHCIDPADYWAVPVL